MAKVYEFLANGFEEIEGLAPVDILRRGGVDIKTVSVTGTEWVETSHGVTIKADLKFEDIASFEDADMLMIPGGMPGSTNLNEYEGVRQALIAQHKAGKRIGAICAAPMVLASTGILEGKKATCYPGFEQYFGENTHDALEHLVICVGQFYAEQFVADRKAVTNGLDTLYTGKLLEQ